MTHTTVHAEVGELRVSAALHLPSSETSDATRVPLVVFYPDAGGVRDTMSAMADRLAGYGFAVLVVNPYWRLPAYEPFDMKTAFSDPSERARIFGLMNGFSTSELVADTVALLDAIDDPRLDTKRVGTMGYCMGGRIAFVAATILGERVAAVAAIHAGGLVSDKPDSPHRQVAGVRARIYLGVADADASCTAEHQAALVEALTSAGVEHQLELYTGAIHGFAVSDFSVYDEAAAEKHWERVRALFDATLR